MAVRQIHNKNIIPGKLLFYLLRGKLYTILGHLLTAFIHALQIRCNKCSLLYR